MSSNPPTDGAASRTARWRDPAGWSLRTRLVAAMIGLLAVLGVAVGATAEITVHRILYDRVDAQLANAAERSERAVERPGTWDGRPPHGRGRPGGDGPGPSLTQQDNTFLALIRDGQVVSAAVLTVEDGLPAPTELPSTLDAKLLGIPVNGAPHTIDLGTFGDYRVVALPVAGGAVVTGLPLADTQETLLMVAIVVTGVTLVALLVAAWAGAVIVRRNLRPLSRVAATATHVSELRLDRGAVELAQRVPEPDTDPRTEVGQVGAALNRMLDHVGHALEARHASEMQVRQFVADASHELRTPLAAIRGYAELSRRSRNPVPEEVAHVLRRVESEAQRMTTLVEDLLLLARLDAGRPLVREPVDLTMLVVDAVSDAHAAGPGHDWQLDLPAEPVVVTGDPARLHQVLGNLLANARTHTPEGTTVTVAVQASGGEALLRVVDGGPGIPADLLPHIFERFARGDSSRSRAAGSTGLGLSIVHAVVTAHGGTVSVDSAPGRTAFTVRLPVLRKSADRPDPVHQHVAEVVQ